MALTADQKTEIIIKLIVATNFDITYSQTNREWFINHMIEHYASSGTADASIESAVDTFLKTCKTIVTAKKNFTIGIVFSAAILRTTLNRRVQIIYGALAAKPDLALPANSSFFDFIIKRRFRAVMRMDYYVNPNGNGYFRYPYTCSSAKGNLYSLNTEATPFWVTYNSNWNGRFFRIAPTPAIGPPISTVFCIEKLFKAKQNSCLGNLLDCARVLSIVYMDSLFEAVNKNTLLDYLASKPDTNLANALGKIHPNSFLGVCHVNDLVNSNFITDTSSESLFNKPRVLASDLQIGDHPYIYNHPLYKVFNPNGDWSGEHALVYDMGNRDYKTASGFLFGGHGKEGTLYQFYSAFLQKLKTYLERAYKIARVHLEFMQKGIQADGIHSFSGGSVKIFTTANGVKLFEYTKRIYYTDYELGGIISSQSEYVIGHGAPPSGNPNTPWVFSPFFFWIPKETKIAQIGALPTEPITFIRSAVPSPGSTSMIDYSLEFYAIPYRKPDAPNDTLYNLFELNANKIRLKQITIADLFSDPFAVVPGTSNLITTQPRVDTSVTYLNFLRTQGGIT
jgi:hypothetical protein